MEKFKENFLSKDVQPQLISLILVVLILTVFSVVVFLKLKKQKITKAPKGIVFFAEMYVSFFIKEFNNSASKKITKSSPYLFALLSFLFVGNLLGLIGFDPPVTSYSVTLTLAFASWLGIYVVGLMYQKWAFFKRYSNPVELVGQIAPLVSLSFRIFGNILSGTVIVFLIYRITGYVWEFIPVIGKVNLLGPIFTPFLHLYFDLFSGLVQGYVFMFLTLTYWTIAADEGAAEENKKNKKNIKKGLKFFRKERR